MITDGSGSDPSTPSEHLIPPPLLQPSPCQLTVCRWTTTVNQTNTPFPTQRPPLPTYTWKEYAGALPEWGKDLLSLVNFVDRRQLLTALRNDECLFMVSDGGAANQRGSFGSVIASSEHIIIECGGRAQGADPRSFRAEGYGILVILRLAFHIRYFYLIGNASLRFRLYCDSESLLKRIDASRRLLRTLPRRFLFSEVDVKI
jgi:hypothetical protein